MGMGIAGIARGVKQGFEGAGIAARQMEEDERKKVAAERDTERFRMEKVRFAEEEDKINAKKDLAAGLSRVSELYSSGGGICSEGQGNAPVAANPVADAPRMGLSSVPAQAAPAPTGDTPAATGLSATPQPDAPKRENPFMTGGENKYANPKVAQEKYYAAKTKLLQDYYNRIGEPEKALAVPKVMSELKNFEFEEKTGAALSAMALGAPGAVAAMSKVYQYFNDGKTLDPESGTFDPKTKTWTGLKVTDENGKTTTLNLTQEQIFGMAKQKDAAAVAKFNIERGDKLFDQTMEGRKVAATERSAKASETSAGASVISANASMLRAKNMNSDDDLVRNARIDADIGRTISNSLSSRFKVDNTLKPSDNDRLLAGAGDTAAAGRIKTYENQMKALGAAQGIAESIMGRRRDVNKGVTVQEATALAAEIVERRLSGKEQLQAQSDDNGVYVMRGSKKIYIQ